MNFAVCAERKEQQSLASLKCNKVLELALQLFQRELDPETFEEIFVEGGIFDGALVDFLNELFPNVDIPEYPGLPEVPDEGWRCMKGISIES